MDPSTGKTVIFFGILVTIAGVVIYFFHDRLGWFGRLPGDIRVERPNFRFYLPLTTLLLCSLAGSLLLWLYRRLH